MLRLAQAAKKAERRLRKLGPELRPGSYVELQPVDRALGEGAAIATAMIPFLLAAILFSYFGLQRRKWQQGGTDK